MSQNYARNTVFYGKSAQIAVMCCVLAIIAMLFAAPAAAQDVEVYPAPIPEGDWIVTAIIDDAHFLMAPVAETQRNGCTIREIRVRCIDRDRTPPTIGTTCWLNTADGVLQCGKDIQRVVWERTTVQECKLYLPLVNPEAPPRPPCSCAGYSADVKVNGVLMYSLALLPDPLFGSGSPIRITAGDTARVVFRWQGNLLDGADPCYRSHYVKIKCPAWQTAKVIGCAGAVCSYTCADIGMIATCKTTAVVELDSETCLGVWETVDP